MSGSFMLTYIIAASFTRRGTFILYSRWAPTDLLTVIENAKEVQLLKANSFNRQSQGGALTGNYNNPSGHTNFFPGKKQQEPLPKERLRALLVDQAGVMIKTSKPTK